MLSLNVDTLQLRNVIIFFGILWHTITEYESTRTVDIVAEALLDWKVEAIFYKQEVKMYTLIHIKKISYHAAIMCTK